MMTIGMEPSLYACLATITLSIAIALMVYGLRK